jgi:hypothetical protein
MVFCGNSSAAGFKYSTLSDEMGKWDSSGTQALPVLSTSLIRHLEVIFLLQVYFPN